LGAAIISAGGWRWAFYVNLPVAVVAILVGRSVLTPDGPRVAAGAIDYAGIGLVSVALASLVLAISEGPDWGWGGARVVTAFVVALAAGAAFVRRCVRHPEPVLHLPLFRARSFSVANAATLLYAMGFFAMLLGNILFLTSVWHYSILRAGLAVTPSPIVVACVSGPAGRLATRMGFRRVIMSGSLFFAGGLIWYGAVIGTSPHYLADWLPGSLTIGLGIGLTFPVLSAASVSSLPPERFAVGSAVNQTARQVGGALGIAILVALLGNATVPSAVLDHFRHLWFFSAAMAASSGLVAGLLRGPVRSDRRAGSDGPVLAGQVGSGGPDDQRLGAV
jgi:MFS family permease